MIDRYMYNGSGTQGGKREKRKSKENSKVDFSPRALRIAILFYNVGLIVNGESMCIDIQHKLSYM